MGSLPPLRMNSPREESSLVVAEAIDFAKTVACHFAILLRVDEKMNSIEHKYRSLLQKKIHPSLCLYRAIQCVGLCKSFPHVFFWLFFQGD